MNAALSRFLAFFLAISLALPNSAWALRSLQLVNNSGLEETLASALEQPKQPILQEAEQERILKEVWEEVIERGWLYHGTSLNNLESIQTWGLDADHKPFDTQEVDTFFRLHQKYFNLQDPYKSTRQNEIISLSYNRSLAEVFSAKPPEVIDILLRESERMIVETNPENPSNIISDSERQWLIQLHAKYAAWAETHQPLVVAIPLKEGIERALFYRRPSDLLSNYRMNAETLYRMDPLFAFLDFDVFKVMAKARFRRFERTGFEKTTLARQLQSDLREILQDVEVSRVGGPYSGNQLSISPSPDVFIPISEYAPTSVGLGNSGTLLEERPTTSLAGLEEKRAQLSAVLGQLEETPRLLADPDRVTDVAGNLELSERLKEAGYPEGKMLVIPEGPVRADAFQDGQQINVYAEPQWQEAVRQNLQSRLDFRFRMVDKPDQAQVIIGSEGLKNELAFGLLQNKQTFLVVDQNSVSAVTANRLAWLLAEGELTAGRVLYLYTDLENNTALFA